MFRLSLNIALKLLELRGHIEVWTAVSCEVMNIQPEYRSVDHIITQSLSVKVFTH